MKKLSLVLLCAAVFLRINLPDTMGLAVQEQSGLATAFVRSMEATGVARITDVHDIGVIKLAYLRILGYDKPGIVILVPFSTGWQIAVEPE